MYAQNTPKPKEIFLPKVVPGNSCDDVRQRSPARKTPNAIKKE